MKAKINGMLFGKDAKVSTALAVGLLIFIGLGCFGRGGGASPPEYVGAWKGADGTILTIRADGSGDYKSGGSEVTNGSVEVKDKKLSLTLMGIGKTFTVDEAPKGDRMKLDGIVFTKGSGSSATSDKDSTAPKTSEDRSSADKTDSGETPGSSEIDSLVKNTTNDFASAVEDEDFSSFMANTSDQFQTEFSADRMKEVFKTFIEKKDAAVPILREATDAQPDYSSPPKVEEKMGRKVLVANGSLPAGRYKVNFEYEYVQDGNDWKLWKIQVKL